MELNALQLAIVGAVAVILVQAIKLFQAKSGKIIPRPVITILAYIFAVVLAYFFLRPEVPPLADPATFAEAIIMQAVTVFGAATLIYNLLLAKVMEKLGLSASQRVIAATAKPLDTSHFIG